MNKVDDSLIIQPKEHQRFKALIQKVLVMAKEKGATAAEVDASTGNGLTVSVRLGEVETLEYHRDQSVGVTVYFGKKKGSASSTDLDPAAIQSTVEAACYIAQYTGEDQYSGLADPELIAKTWPDLDLYHPWNIDPEQAIAMCRDCESHAMKLDKRITNSEGASLSSHQGLHYYGNSHGFLGGYPGSRHSISCSLIASSNNEMERDYDFTVARAHEDMQTPHAVAEGAVARTVRRLDARRLSTRQAPVIFEAQIAGTLLSSFISAIKGGNLYRKASFLLDYLGKPVFSSHVHIHERPHILKGLGSAPFDHEGLATNSRDFIKDGILQSYVLGSYSARRLGLKPTGNAGGVHNLFIETGNLDKAGLLKKMGTGLLVTELMGQGVNILTGDYSRGVAGFWVENGEIQYPVHEITIASNLRDMFLNLVEVGNDVERRGNYCSGSILLESMMIGGE